MKMGEIQLEKRWVRFLLLALGGVLTGLCLVFSVLGLLEWLTLIPAGLVILRLLPDPRVRLRTLYGYGLFFFFSFYLAVFHWFISMYPLEFTGITPAAAMVVVLFAWLGLSLVQALMGGLCFVFGGIVLRNRFVAAHPLLRPFLFGGVYAVYEWTQNLGWWGVPWGRLPLGQSFYLAGMQTASLFGSYFITFLLVTVNLLFAHLFTQMMKGKGRPVRERLCRGAVLGIAGILLFQYGAGGLLYLGRGRDVKTPERRITVAAVQGNISSKWNNADADAQCRDVYSRYTKAAAEAGADVVVWPETAVTHTIWNSNGSVWYRFCSELAKENQITLLVGAFSMEDEAQYNSVFCFLPDGSLHETVYNKRKLVPFGEFVPFGGLIETLVPPLAELVMSGSDLDAGEGANAFFLDDGTIGSLICFDSIYDGLIRESVMGGAQLLCLSTNDSWFASSRALNMHLSQAQLRAVESGRWIVRSANTGITSAINSRGEIIDSIPILEEGMLVCEVAYEEEMTLYTRIGNLFVYGWIALVFLVTVWEFSLGIRKKISKTT